MAGRLHVRGCPGLRLDKVVIIYMKGIYNILGGERFGICCFGQNLKIIKNICISFYYCNL